MRDGTEFDAFYAATGARIMGQVYLMIGDRCETQDAVAEAYARAWQRWGTVSGYADPAAWVRKVAYRIAVSSWRRAIRRRRAHDQAQPTLTVPGPGPESVALRDALHKLPAAQRRAIVLHHLAGLTIAEIAAETDCSVSAVKARLARGRSALAEMFNDNDKENTHARR